MAFAQGTSIPNVNSPRIAPPYAPLKANVAY